MDFGILTGKNIAIAAKAQKEGRLWFRVADQYGRSCNGGDRSFSPPLPPGRGRPGKWAPKIDNPLLCSRGYHVTRDPLRFRGLIVQLVEVDQVVENDGIKAVAGSLRVLGLVDPVQCIDARFYAAAARPMLQGANLNGANLEGATLTRATLTRANLTRANLDGANLTRATLYGANLNGANLTRANLEGANLYGANLNGANLTRANLEGANLDGANLNGANLNGANLNGANLNGANLDGAIHDQLTRWPDEYKRPCNMVQK